MRGLVPGGCSSPRARRHRRVPAGGKGDGSSCQPVPERGERVGGEGGREQRGRENCRLRDQGQRRTIYIGPNPQRQQHQGQSPTWLPIGAWPPALRSSLWPSLRPPCFGDSCSQNPVCSPDSQRPTMIERCGCSLHRSEPEPRLFPRRVFFKPLQWQKKRGPWKTQI